jgi:hypothetical protein
MGDWLSSRLRRPSPRYVFAMLLLGTVIIQELAQWNDDILLLSGQGRASKEEWQQPPSEEAFYSPTLLPYTEDLDNAMTQIEWHYQGQTFDEYMQRPQMFSTMMAYDHETFAILREPGASADQPLQAPVHHPEEHETRRRGGKLRQMKPTGLKSSSSRRRRTRDSRRRSYGGHRRRQHDQPRPTSSPTSMRFFHKGDHTDHEQQGGHQDLESQPSRAPTPGGRSSASKPKRAHARAASSFVDDMAAVSGSSDGDDEDFENMSDVDSHGNVRGLIDDSSDDEPSADVHGASLCLVGFNDVAPCAMCVRPCGFGASCHCEWVCDRL